MPTASENTQDSPALPAAHYLARAKSGEPLDVLVQSILLADPTGAVIPELLDLFYRWGLAGGHNLDVPAPRAS